MIQPWKQISWESLIRTRVFDLLRRIATSPRTGRDCEFFLLDTPDWVNIVPVTPDGELVLVRQYRHGTDEVTLEIPGGMVDPGDPSAEAAARRELWEETGYRASRLRPVGWVHPNPAIQNTRCHTFVAEEAIAAGAPEPDGEEDLEVVRVPLGRVPALVAEGSITHALVICAFVQALGLGAPSQLEPDGSTEES
jgi:8-oxo-dGTP pyrophosphatase MutT (NUDIX family)